MAFFTPHCFKPALLLGLDIDHTAIRMVELSQRSDRRFQLERRAQLKLPAGVVNDRHIQHPAQLADHIATLAAQLGSRRKRVALALPADTVITRQMQVPAHIGAAALDALIAAEAGGYLAVTPDQVRVDYQFSGAGSDDPAQRDIVLAAARREQVEDRIAAVEAAGLTPAVLDIDLYAAYAACLYSVAEPMTTEPAIAESATTGPAPVALLMCDASRTQIALFDRRQLLYHRELPGCDNRTDAMQIAIAAMRSLPLATPVGMILSHLFIGGDCGASRLAQLVRLVRAAPAQTLLGCSAAQPFAAMQIGNRAADAMAANDDEENNSAAYLVACGLAMRRTAR